MTRVFFHTLKSKKQLKKFSGKKIISAEFTDETGKFFEISFDVGNDKKQDILISFETRTPHVFISDIY